ncbi:unnamed protein product [Caenorhabditis sp. 36 PRJEB53466]|nr:unnamed protein product [Caenorhabditis sp. 36 PRJEB53466]
MSKKFLVDGRAVWVEDAEFEELREKFKENVTVDDLESWESKEVMERYNASTFIDKARHYLSLSPPDLIQSSEKIWFAAVYAVKEAYLSCGGIDLKSHNSLTYFCRFALHHSGLPWKRFDYLSDCWVKAERMHRDVYGSGNYRPSEYGQIISDVEAFVFEFAQFDRKTLWSKFNETFIAGNDPDVQIKKESHTIKLGGFSFKCDYSVFV